MDAVIVSIFYSPPDQEEVDEAFIKKMEESASSKTLVLMGHFIKPGICWKDNTAGRKQSWKFLDCTWD